MDKRKKLFEKKLDMIVLNNPTRDGEGFQHDTNKVMLITPGKRPVQISLAQKDLIAARIVDVIATML